MLGGALALVLLDNGGGSGADVSMHAGVAGSVSRFAMLSDAHTNRCNLGARELRDMAPPVHLQGACCFPMDEKQYRRQVRGLRHYRGLRRVVPSDPYDIQVRLAMRLLSYRGMALSGDERAAYAKASERGDTGGPCCCRCWRWQAFRGQARYLLNRRDFSAAQLARVWDLEEGCGGPGEET